MNTSTAPLEVPNIEAPAAIEAPLCFASGAFFMAEWGWWGGWFGAGFGRFSQGSVKLLANSKSTALRSRSAYLTLQAHLTICSDGCPTVVANQEASFGVARESGFAFGPSTTDLPLPMGCKK